MFEDINKEKQQDLEYFFGSEIPSFLQQYQSTLCPGSLLSRVTLIPGDPDTQRQILTCSLQLETQSPQVFPVICQNTPNSVVPEPRLAASGVRILCSSADGPEKTKNHIHRRSLSGSQQRNQNLCWASVDQKAKALPGIGGVISD